MGVLVKTISSSTGNTTDIINNNIGQMANMITSTGLATVKNDNNPSLGSNTGRVIDLQAGNSQHYLRIYNTSTPSSASSYIYFSVRSCDNSKDLISTNTNYTNGRNAYLIWGNNAFAFYYYSIYCGFEASADNNGNWWVHLMTYLSFYIYNSDTSYGFSYSSPYGLDGGGYTALLPCRIQTGSNVLSNFFIFNNTQGYSDGQFLQDGQGKRYMVTSDSGMAIRED
jgi:hypothetical protein